MTKSFSLSQSTSYWAITLPYTRVSVDTPVLVQAKDNNGDIRATAGAGSGSFRLQFFYRAL